MMQDILEDLETARTKVRACLVPLVDSLIDEIKSPGGLTEFGMEQARSIIGELE
jgi:hypothetical protein